MNLKQLDKWHQTKTGFVVFATVELALAYLFASLAINSGSLFEWVVAILFFIGVIQNLVKLIGAFVRGNKARKS